MHPAVVSVLSVGRDPALLSSRSAILKNASYEVTTAVTSAQILDSYFTGNFDVVILCHSVPAEERRKLVRLVRNHTPSVPVLVLTAYEGQAPEPGSIRVHNNPQEILEAVAHAVNGSAQTS